MAPSSGRLTRRAAERRGRGLVALVAAALVLAWAVLLAPGRALALDLPLVNLAPIAVNDTYTAQTGVSLSVPAPGVLKNDLDLDLDPLKAALVDGGGNGSIDLAPDGSFTFKSGGSFVGDRTFTYRAWDGAAWSNVATVTIHVGPKPAPTPTPTPAPTPTPTPRPTLPLPSIGPLPSIIDPLPSVSPSPTPSPRPGPSATPSPRPDPSPASSGSSSGSPTSGGTGPAGGGSPGGGPDPSSGGDGARFSVGRAGDLDGPPIDELDLGDAGIVGVDSIVDWAVPSLVLGVPGILLVLAVGAQVLGGALWIPVVRRWLGGLGLRRRDRASAAPPSR